VLRSYKEKKSSLEVGKIIWELHEDENALIYLFCYFCGHSHTRKSAPLNEAVGILRSHRQCESSSDLH